MNQITLEKTIHPHHIYLDIKDDIESSFISEIKISISAIKKWCDVQEYSSKNIRKDFIRQQDLHGLVVGLIAKTVMYCQKSIPLVSFASMVDIGFEVKLDNIKTVCELIALLAPTELYELSKDLDGTYTIQTVIELPEALQKRLELYCYLPPMIEKPNVIRNNNDSGLVTIKKDSIILGSKLNHHNKQLSLDVINTLNKTEYVLDKDFIDNFEKDWFREELSQEELKELSMTEQQDYQISLSTWKQYQDQFNVLKDMLIDKSIYFTHKYDKRGRIYAQGYHFNTQGTSYEKACINIKHKEIVTGELSENTGNFYSVGMVKNNETIEQALNRLGIDFDTDYLNHTDNIHHKHGT